MEPEAYLESGTNELKILEFSAGGLHFGLNLLKTSRVLNAPKFLTRTIQSHPSVKGIMDDHGITIPVIDLGQFLGLTKDESQRKNNTKERIIVTEFFGRVNGFLIEYVHYVHTILWKRVFDSQDILGKLGSDYVIGIVRPTEQDHILLLDYEKIILELSPDLEAGTRQKLADHSEIQGKQRIILLAEDSSAVRDMLAMELSEMGFEVLAVKDGKEALRVFEQTPGIALVISDVEMPQLEGLSLTKLIKERNPDIPVIVYSSIGDIGMKERARAVSADAHVTKLNIEELLATAKRLLEGQSS